MRFSATRHAALAVALFTIVMVPSDAASASGSGTGLWAATGSLGVARYDHSASLLTSGEVLVAGGVGSGARGNAPIASAEIFSPTTGSWRPVASLSLSRSEHTATVIDKAPCGKLCGQVLVAGGFGGSSPSNATGTVEIYSPAANSWSLVAPLTVLRYNHSATVLRDGRLLVAGGRSVFLTPSAEIFDPEEGRWSFTGSLVNSYYDHTATLLPDGKVLVVGAGSSGGSSAEVFDPDAVDPFTGLRGVWTATAAPRVQRFNHTATVLPNGKVLVAGTAGGTVAAGASAEIYDPSTATWSTTGSLDTRRSYHSATLLGNGDVLVAGGATVAEAARYHYTTGAWTTDGAISTNRDSHTANLLPGGRVLVAGGRAGTTPLSSAELYEPPAPPLPEVSVGDVAVPEGNAADRSAVFAVTLSEPSATAVTVAYSTADATAVAAADYTAVTGTTTFAPGAVSALVVVEVTGDTSEEPDETFSLSLSAPSGATLGDPNGTGVIVNDDPSAGRRLAIGDAAVHEGHAGQRQVVLTVSLSRPSQAPVSVSYATSDAAAVSPSDYVATSGTLLFAPGVTSRTITVLVNADAAAEGPETLVVQLSGAIGAPVADATGVVTILDSRR